MEARNKSDTLHGLDAIAKHLGIRRGQAKYWHEQKLIPTFKMGRTVCALRSSIEADQRAREAAARTPTAD